MDEIRVRLKDGSLVRQPDGKWKAEGRVRPGLVAHANAITDEYRYSPADGYPGYRLAELVAQALGGEAVLPEPPPLPKGAIP